MVQSADGVHGVEIKKFKVNKPVPRGGKPVAIDFVASAPGTYEILCSEYCGDGHEAMAGTLVVQAKARRRSAPRRIRTTRGTGGMTRHRDSSLPPHWRCSAVGCDEKLSDFAGPTPNLEPTFSSIQRDIFNSTDSAGRRACTACHNAPVHRSAGNLNLSDATSYAALVSVASRNKPGAIRVIPGDPDGSYIIQKIEGAPGIVGERMPRTGGPYLTPNQIVDHPPLDSARGSQQLRFS